MTDSFSTVSPVDGQVIVERPLASDASLSAVIERSQAAQVEWSRTTVAERARYMTAFVDAVLSEREVIAEEITRQMGRPIAQTPGELRGFEERARHMIAIAAESLAPIEPEKKEGFSRYIERLPVGVVLTLAPWNYPLLTAVNSIVPALLAGNSVILKHSAQTPLCAERFLQAFERAGVPEGVFQIVHCSHSQVAQLIGSPGIDFVAFTGSVDGGRAVQQAAARRFIATGLELGGKDPAYVRPDAALESSVENLVDGAFFNSGQSCCGIERIYVHQDVYDAFVEAFVQTVRGYKLGNPMDAATTLGPVVKTAAADFVQAQVNEAVAAGATALVQPSLFEAHQTGTPYLAPQVLVSVDHSMRVMTEESFGPVVGIMRVEGDAEAVRLMNDSVYGLTASVWTADLDAARSLGRQVQTGTWFMNRCDYLDPALAWTGVKNSGRGCTLSRVGFEALTRPKSYHLRL